jgi:hypothetical protein
MRSHLFEHQLSMSMEIAPPNRRDTANIMQAHRKTQISIIKNNLLLVGLVNIITILGFLFSITFYQWFRIDYKFGSVWFGLIYSQQENYGIDVNNHILERICKDNSTCAVEKNLVYGGIVVFLIIIGGIIVHIVFLAQIMIIAEKTGSKIRFTTFKPIYFKIVALFFYSGSLLFWVFFNQVYKIEGNCGVSVWMNLVALSLYFLSMIYYGVYKKKLAKQKIIENLLNADKYVIQETETEEKPQEN